MYISFGYEGTRHIIDINDITAMFNRRDNTICLVSHDKLYQLHGFANFSITTEEFITMIYTKFFKGSNNLMCVDVTNGKYDIIDLEFNDEPVHNQPSTKFNFILMVQRAKIKSIEVKPNEVTIAGIHSNPIVIIDPHIGFTNIFYQSLMGLLNPKTILCEIDQLPM